MSYYKNKIRLILKWSMKKTENDNFYYDLEEKNLEDLISMISLITNIKNQDIENYALEIRNDFHIKKHISSYFSKTKSLRDIEVDFGRRIGWYIFIRIYKPKLVVETGVHHGVGACVIAAALMKNSQEGYLGKYLGTDIDLKAGGLFTTPYKSFGEIIYGDSISTLRQLESEIDIFINDSGHDVLYEYQEYQTINSKLAENFVILGDNSHVSSSLYQFAKENNYKYVFFSEKPKNHWYPGAGIGICAP